MALLWPSLTGCLKAPRVIYECCSARPSRRKKQRPGCELKRWPTNALHQALSSVDCPEVLKWVGPGFTHVWFVELSCPFCGVWRTATENEQHINSCPSCQRA